MDVKKKSYYTNQVLEECKLSLAKNEVDLEILKWMIESEVKENKDQLPLMEKSKAQTEAQIEKLTNSIKVIERLLAEQLSEENKGVN